MAIFGKDESPARSGSRAGSNETTLSIISAGTTVTGDVECSGVLKVEGRVDGSVRRARMDRPLPRLLQRPQTVFEP